MTELAELDRFTAELPFSLDDFQQRACSALERGHGVLVRADRRWQDGGRRVRRAPGAGGRQ